MKTFKHRDFLEKFSCYELAERPKGSIEERNSLRLIGKKRRKVKVRRKRKSMKRENFLMTSGNKNYKEDIKYTIQLTDYLLVVLGVWPFSKNKSNSTRLLVKLFLVIVCYALLAFFIVPAILHMVLIEKNAHLKIKKLPLLFYNVMLVAKYSGLLFQENKIASCFRHIEEDWKNINSQLYRSIMRDKARLGRQFLIACGVLTYSSISFNRVFLPLTRGAIVTPLNVTIRPLPCSGYYVFFNDQISPNYDIVFCLQCVSGMVTFFVTTSICGLIALFVMHACGQLEILICLVNKIVERIGIEENETKKRLTVMVEHQIRVRNFLRLVESTMQQICLFELMGCTLTMCFFGYCLITDWDSSNAFNVCPYLVGLTCVTGHIFMFCFVGEQLTLQAEKVAITSTILEWHRLPDKTAKNVILIIAMSNLPLKITAGNVVELSLQTFGQVIKTAAAYCNILRTVTV